MNDKGYNTCVWFWIYRQTLSQVSQNYSPMQLLLHVSFKHEIFNIKLRKKCRHILFILMCKSKKSQILNTGENIKLSFP